MMGIRDNNSGIAGGKEMAEGKDAWQQTAEATVGEIRT